MKIRLLLTCLDHGSDVGGRRAASQVLSVAQELSRHSESLTHEVGSFLTNVKAA